MSQNKLLNNVNNWLEKEGYPLEMLVARYFQKEGFFVKISDFYIDFETEKPREIDITAQYSSELKKPIILQVSFHIECKSSLDKPWILFISDTSQNELGFPYNIDFLVSTRIYRAFLFSMLNSKQGVKLLSKLNNIPLLLQQNISYGITQAFTNGLDVTYTAVMGAIKSSVARVIRFDKIPNFPNGLYQCGIAFPVVVFDGSLLESKLNDSGEILLNEVDSSILYWKFPNPSDSTPFVFVVTKKSLPDFVSKATETAKTLINLSEEFLPKLTEIAEASSQKYRAG